MPKLLNIIFAVDYRRNKFHENALRYSTFLTLQIIKAIIKICCRRYGPIFMPDCFSELLGNNVSTNFLKFSRVRQNSWIYILRGTAKINKLSVTNGINDSQFINVWMYLNKIE